MSPRAGIIAGKSVIVVQVQDSVDAALNKISSKLNKFSAKVGRLGFELFSGGLLGSLGVVGLGKQFQDFEDKLLFLATKLVATDAEFAAVEKTVRQLGRTTSFTTSQVADGATILAQAGFKAHEVIKLLQPTLDLARGAQIDLSASGAILANTLRSFSLETEKATEVASQFIAAARLGTLDVLDLKESIKEVLGTVRNLNIDLPTTLALITQLAERSLKGTKAGTSLNTALLQLASKGPQLAKLGISLPENIDGPGFINFLEQLYKQISKMGNLKRTAVLQSIFNIRGGRAITALDDIKKIIDLQKEIAAAGNEARIAAVKMDSGFGGAIRRATSAIESLTLRWGKLLATAIIPTLDLVPALSLALEQLTATNQNLVTGLILTPVALLGLGAGLLVASFATAKLAGFIGLLGAGFKSTSRIIGGLITQQLTNVAVLMDRIRKTGKRMDFGLSALLLTPQKVGGRGRNAKKIKPTSFFGRVGVTKLTGTGALVARGVDAIQARARFGIDNYLNTGAVRYFKKQKIGPLVKPLVSFVGRVFSTAGKTINNFGKRKALINPFQIFKGATEPKHLSMLASRVAAGIETIFSGMGDSSKAPPFLAFFEGIGAKISRAFNGILTVIESKGTRIGQKFLVFMNQFGNPKKKAPFLKFFDAIPKMFSKVNAVRIKAPTAFLNSLLFGTKRTAVFGAIATGIGKIGSALRIASHTGISLFARGLILLTKIDFVRIFLGGAKAVWSLTKAFGALAKISFITLTTLSGWGNILTFLMIFGPRIKFIRDAFTRLGAGISAAFREIGMIGTALGPAFTLIARSMKTLLAGDGTLGLDQLSTGLSSIVSIVGNKLSQAWNHVTLAIAPAYDFMAKMISATMELGGLFGSLLGLSSGNLFSGVADLLSGKGLGGGLLDTIKQFLTELRLEELFKSLGVAILAMTQTVNWAMQGIFNIIADTMYTLRLGIIALLGSLPSAVFGEGPMAAAKKMAGPTFKRWNPATQQFEEMAESFYQHTQKTNRANKAFDKFGQEMEKALDQYTKNISKIFSAATLTSKKVRDLNKNWTASQGEQFLLEEANRMARIAEMRRGNKLPNGKAPTLTGGLETTQRTNPIVQMREELVKLRKKLGFENSLTRSIGMNRTRDKYMSGMREKVADLRKRIKEELKAQRQLPISAPQRALLSDIVSSTTGSFQQTRRNMIKLASGQSVEQKSLTALEQIQTNTSNTTGNLDQILQFGLPVTMGLK